MIINSKNLFIIFVFALIPTAESLARTGFIYSLNVASVSLSTTTEINITTTPTASSNDGVFTASRDETFNEANINLGYLYKRRRTADFFILPEFYYMTLDDDAIYGSSFKFGPVLGKFNLYANIGVSRIPQFKQNKVHAGLGMHYQINKNYLINFEWIQLDEFTERTEDSSIFGAQTVTNNTNTDRSIDLLTIGLAFLY